MSENKIDVKKILKNEDMVKKLAFVFIVLGFVVGYSASYIAQVSESAGIAVMQSAQAVLLLGVLLFVYYFVVFVDIGSKKDEPTCKHCEKPIQTDVKFCPHCGKDVDTDVEKTVDTDDPDKKDEDKKE